MNSNPTDVAITVVDESVLGVELTAALKWAIVDRVFPGSFDDDGGFSRPGVDDEALGRLLQDDQEVRTALSDDQLTVFELLAKKGRIDVKCPSAIALHECALLLGRRTERPVQIVDVEQLLQEADTALRSHALRLTAA